MVTSTQSTLTLTALLITFTTTFSLIFQSSTIPEFPLTISIDPTYTTITTHIPLSQQHLFHGIAFGNPIHQSTYAILYHPITNILSTPPTFTIHQLSSNSITINPYTTDTSHYILSFAKSNTHIILTIKRKNNIGNPYYIFNPNQQLIPITYIYGNNINNYKYIFEQLIFKPNINSNSNIIRRLLLNTTNISTESPTTTIAYTTTATTTTDVITTSKTYESGIIGYFERGQDWINNDASQLHLLIVCAAFAGILILFLCCCYCQQSKKTRKLKETIFSFQPDLIQNERDKKNKNYENGDDVPFVDAADPDSSIEHNHHDEYIAPAAGNNEILEEAPADDEANYRKPNPNINVHKIPTEIANKLEESLSVESSHKLGIIAPPPPNEPIPNDIMEIHRQRAKTQMQNKNIKNDNRRNTYHPNPNNKKKNELEMQPVNENGLERVRTQSHVSQHDDDPPTPVSNEHNIFIDNKFAHEKGTSLKNIANKRLSKSRNNNDPALALLSEAPRQKVNVNKNNNENENDFDNLSSPSAKMLFNENDNIDKKNDPFASIAAEFNALSNNLNKEPSQKKHKAEQSGNDIILGMFDNGVVTPRDLDDLIDKHDDGNLEESLSVAEPVVNNKQPAQKKPKVEQSGNDIILGMFDENESMNLEESLSAAEPESPKQSGNNAVLNILNAEPKPEQPSEPNPKHRGKQVEDDPFASLDMDSNDLFSVKIDKPIENPKPKHEPEQKQKEEIKIENEIINTENDMKDKDSEAMGVLGGLLSANPEFGDNNNIFGGTGNSAADAILNSGKSSNMVDLEKYANVKDTEHIDYDKLTKISDTDQYKVVSVQEHVTVDDGDGNVQEIDQQIDGNEELNELDNILNDNMENVNENVQIIAEPEPQVNDNNGFDEELNNMNSPLDALMNVDSDNDKSEEFGNNAVLNMLSAEPEPEPEPEVKDDDPFSAMNNDPFAALNVTSPLDNIMQVSNNNYAALNTTSPMDNNGVNTFDNMQSPLDNIMQSADNNEQQQQQEEIEVDPFDALNISSPLDNIMQAADDNNEPPSPKPNANVDNFDNMQSPLDNIMNATIDDNDNDTDSQHVEQQNNDPFAELNVSSPLDNIMNAAVDIDDKQEEQNDDPFAQMNSSPLDDIMNEANDSDEDEDDNNMQSSQGQGHKTIDIDNLLQHGNTGSVVFNDEKEDDSDEDEDDSDEDEHSMGSEIIHDTPRVSAVVHEPLDPQIFGKQNHDDSTSESDYSNGTDPNAY